MIMAASEALAASNTPKALAAGRIYPGLSNVRSISARVAGAVMQQAHLEGVATHEEAISVIQAEAEVDVRGTGVKEMGEDGGPLMRFVVNNMYFPVYNQLAYVPPGLLE
ncbi:unnamed protein product [Choristocarpus tenellus]